MICGSRVRPETSREIRLGRGFRILWGTSCTKGCDSQTVIAVLVFKMGPNLEFRLLDAEDTEAYENRKQEVVSGGGKIINEILIAPSVLWAMIGGKRDEVGTKAPAEIPPSALKELNSSVVGPFSN